MQKDSGWAIRPSRPLKASEGIYPLPVMKGIQAGGRQDFSGYYTARYDAAIFDPGLKENIVFSRHNLAQEGSFNEFNLILCRNVLIYFNQRLQERVHDLLVGSLAPLGYLGLGARESLKFCPHEARFKEIDAKNRLFRMTS